MAEHGATLIEDGDTIIHHCNTGALATVDWGTALGVIRTAHEQGKRIHVLVANVYLNSTSDVMIIAHKGLANSNSRDYALYYNPTGSKFTFLVGNGSISGSVSSQETIVAGRWYNIMAWHDSFSNTLNIQVNNGTASSVSYTSGAMDTIYPLTLGAHDNGTSGLDGLIDEVALYKRVLTASERTWLYNRGFGRTFAELGSLSGSITYTYGNPAHKHAVTALSTGESYTYDANGNMITRIEGGLTYTQVFDAENRLISVTVSGQTTQFIYDGDGNLIKRIKPDGSRTLYIGGIYEVDKDPGGTVTGTKTYYPAAGAMRVDSTLYYVLKDHLGSASVVTDANGVTLNPGGEQRYNPYGGTRLTPGITSTDRLFTGQREMAGLGIYYYGARFYSPYINRFLSADTIVPGYANPQALNRYSYVLNNPINLTDPTGHKCVGEAEECLDDDGNPINGTGGLGGGNSNSNDLDSNLGQDIPMVLPCGGMLTCPPQSLYDDATSLLPFTSSNACYFLLHDPILCSSSSWQNFPNVTVTSVANYQLDAFGLGGGFIAGFFPAQGTGGIDAIYLTEANSIVVYGYNGNSLNTAGAGLVGGPYAIVGFNIHEPTDYSGVSQAVNVTGAYGPYGATVSYFWSGDEPFAPSAPQGFTLWYSPGLAASVSYSNVSYTPWVAIP
jgi:RHS repeat-associated protein